MRLKNYYSFSATFDTTEKLLLCISNQNPLTLKSSQVKLSKNHQLTNKFVLDFLCIPTNVFLPTTLKYPLCWQILEFFLFFLPEKNLKLHSKGLFFLKPYQIFNPELVKKLEVNNLKLEVILSNPNFFFFIILGE